MGARRDDIISSQRAQIALEVLSPHRPWGAITRLAQEYSISRQTVYDIAAFGKQVLRKGLGPGSRGRQPAEKTVRVNRNRLVRGTVVLSEAGVRQGEVEVRL